MPAQTYPLVRVDCTCVRARHRHGTYAAYDVDRCRCFPCRLAKNNRDQLGSDYRDIGSMRHRCSIVRRLEALHAAGWSGQQIANRLGITKDALNNLRTWPTPNAFAHTVEAVTALYDELWDKQPPGASLGASKGDRISYSRTKAWAARQRFRPALAWDDDAIDQPDATPYRPDYVKAADRGLDEVAIREAMNGRMVKLTREERVEAERRLTEAGHGANEIARRLRTTDRTVIRYRAERAA